MSHLPPACHRRDGDGYPTDGAIMSNQDIQREWLLTELRCVWLDATAVANEAEAIGTSLERRWIENETAATWGLMTGILAPVEPPWCAQWRDAARQARVEKYGPGGLLEREGTQ